MVTSARILLALAVIAVMATTATATEQYKATSDRFYLRGTGCGATEDLFLSDKQGTDEYDGCGILGGLPLNEAVGDEKSLSTRNTDPIIIDASRDLVVVIRAESWVGDGIPGAGQSTVDVSLSGTKVSGGFIGVDFGSATSTKTVTGADNATHTITINIPDSAQGVAIANMTLNVSVHGVNYNVNNLGMSGDSHFTMPTLELVSS